MEEEKLFRIGDVAKMFHISTGTLRHYERIGIVVPEFIEEKSSYRYYGIRQFEVLNTIRYLRVLDMPPRRSVLIAKNRRQSRSPSGKGSVGTILRSGKLPGFARTGSQRCCGKRKSRTFRKHRSNR